MITNMITKLITKLITKMNLFARKLSSNGKYFRRFVDIFTDYLWIRSLAFWEFDLTLPDSQWKRFRTENDNFIRWSFATLEDCQCWSESGADGFSKDDCELLRQLIEQGGFVLTGYANFSVSPMIPDCYAACVTGLKPMTQHCFFRMEQNEGVIRTVYTRQQSRGRGLATRLYAEICCIAEERGFKKLFVDIDCSNLPSIRAVEKAGAGWNPQSYFWELRLFKHSFGFPARKFRQRFCTG
ncbi:MAG: GNAT family N-acetyltransferase [Planctomycetaceae bacterium]|jgi:GNAT superfamily N-acetyltransferase|nr:GNAT family N-acetyltransferase [Planctomycetaceae bacterium]